VRAALLGQIPDLPGLGDEGPNDLESLLSLSFLMMGAGFGIALLGHLTRTRALVTIGVLVVLAGSGVFLVAIGRYG
jgi:hypothetical protein